MVGDVLIYDDVRDIRNAVISSSVGNPTDLT